MLAILHALLLEGGALCSVYVLIVWFSPLAILQWLKTNGHPCSVSLFEVVHCWSG